MVEDFTPALAIRLQNKALIEASAGTGKTWTLTAILLRLLLEDDRFEPREIIATTFTRKAASEMRERVQKRFDALVQLLEGIGAHYARDPSLLQDDEGLSLRVRDLLLELSEKGYAQAKDVLNLFLFEEAAKKGLDALIALMERIQRLRYDLDGLFIGTLDSLCQRLLHEFALETGSAQGIRLIDSKEERSVVERLAYDFLRAYYVKLSDAHYEALSESGFSFTKAVEAIANKVGFLDLSLEDGAYLLARWQEVLAEREAILQSLSYKKALSLFEARGGGDGAVFEAVWQDLLALMNKRKKVAKDLQDKGFFECLQGLQEENIQDNAFLLFWCNPDDFLNKKGKDSFSNFYNKLAVFAPLWNLYLCRFEDFLYLQQVFSPKVEALDGLLRYVRKVLPSYLQKESLGTFHAQMIHLNRSLEDEGGAHSLARYIAHRYPVILVDESQDLNESQRRFLENVYFRYEKEIGFLLLVGDPKQAIYRFRGGDVHNYLALKEKFKDSERYVLAKSYRSSAFLIKALNRLYQPNGDDARFFLSRGIFYEPIESASSGKRDLCLSSGEEIEKPIVWHCCETLEEEEAFVLEAVERLCSEKSIYARRLPSGALCRIEPSDILVLMRSNAHLKKLQHKLEARGVPTQYDPNSSIFAQEVAQEVFVVLQALKRPQHHALQLRLLSGLFFQLSLSEIKRLQFLDMEEGNCEGLTLQALATILQKCGQKWQEERYFSALQEFLSARIGGLSVWERLARLPSPDKERHLLDLRQIQQIVSQKSAYLNAEHFLHWWEGCLKHPPEEEWARALPLPGKNAVRLMTIHKAKGLEAPIVILSSLRSKKLGTREDIYTYHNDDKANGKQLLSVFPPDTARIENLEKEAEEEDARLLYVALTRASDLLLTTLAIAPSRKESPYLFNPLRDLMPLERLSSDPLHVFLKDLSYLQNDSINLLPQEKPPVDPPSLDAPYQKTHFRGWQKSSFSALLRHHLPVEHLAIESADYEFEDDSLFDDFNAENKNFALSFPKGAVYGSFLHHFLEHIDFAHLENFSYVFKRFARAIALEKGFEAPLRQWIYEIIRSPLISGASLSDLKKGHFFREFGFNLACNRKQQLDIKKINQIFASWGKSLAFPNHLPLVGFLRGEIDLFYEHQGRFYVLDYKSNFLGNHMKDYEKESLLKAMDFHHYWLQALIYQTAMHRYLKNRLPNYTPQAHLGGVEYFFLRGCASGAESAGHLAVDVPLDIVLQFDQVLLGEVDDKKTN